MRVKRENKLIQLRNYEFLFIPPLTQFWHKISPVDTPFGDTTNRSMIYLVMFQSEMMKQAEVSAYFKRFDEADRLYLDMDRR